MRTLISTALQTVNEQASKARSEINQVFTRYGYQGGNPPARLKYLGARILNGDPSRDRNSLEDGAVRFVRAFAIKGKPFAAICDGPALLIEAGILPGRQVTSFPSIKTDLRNAGAEWIDQEVVSDQRLVTSRKPDDIPAFNERMIEEFEEASHPEIIGFRH